MIEELLVWSGCRCRIASAWPARQTRLTSKHHHQCCVEKERAMRAAPTATGWRAIRWSETDLLLSADQKRLWTTNRFNPWTSEVKNRNRADCRRSCRSRFVWGSLLLLWFLGKPGTFSRIYKKVGALCNKCALTSKKNSWDALWTWRHLPATFLIWLSYKSDVWYFMMHLNGSQLTFAVF